jgi:hypothetical protein
MMVSCVKALPWNILAVDDRLEFDGLHSELTSSDLRSSRNSKQRVFRHAIVRLLTFSNNGKSDEWRRHLACGLCSLSHGLGVNTQTLMQVLHKSK